MKPHNQQLKWGNTQAIHPGAWQSLLIKDDLSYLKSQLNQNRLFLMRLKLWCDIFPIGSNFLRFYLINPLDLLTDGDAGLITGGNECTSET